MNLYILGKLLKQDKRAVAVVGTRLPTERGKKLTEEFVKELVKEKLLFMFFLLMKRK